MVTRRIPLSSTYNTRDRCSFKAGNRTPNYKKDVINIFKELLSDYDNIAKIMRLIIRIDGAVLFHCTAGKDRTGVIIALLLSLAGVSKEDIVDDYSMSYPYIHPIIRDIKKATSGLPEWYGVTYPEIMEAVL